MAEGERPRRIAPQGLKCFAKRRRGAASPGATRKHNAEEAQIPPEAARFVRRQRLEEAGLWPAPEGWDADLQVAASGPPTSPFHGLADALKRSRLTAPFPREVADGRDSAA